MTTPSNAGVIFIIRCSLIGKCYKLKQMLCQPGLNSKQTSPDTKTLKGAYLSYFLQKTKKKT